MDIVCISDTHGMHESIELPEGDMIIHAGDFSTRGGLQEVERFLTWYNSLSYIYKILIAGNHDLLFEDYPLLKAQLLRVYSDIIYLENEEATVEGIKIYGSPVQPRFHDWAFNVDRGTPIKEFWNRIPENTDILITHGPPYGYGDFIPYHGNIGCEDLLNTVLYNKPKYHIFGHIHESYGL